MKYPPRWYQTGAVEALFDYLNLYMYKNPCVALPTGTGKSLVIAMFCEQVLMQYPNTRILMATHNKELIKQNAEELLDLWPGAPIGIYSAGLDRKEAHMPIVFGSIQSMARNLPAFGLRHLMIVDECHLIPEKGEALYQQSIGYFRKEFSNFRVCGLTATPYRLRSGMLTNNGIFDDICYDVTSLHAFNRLIEDGYLCRLVPNRTNVALDVSKVATRNGDFDQSALEAAIDRTEVMLPAVNETLERAHNRRSWLLFCAGINHAEHTAQMFRDRGIACAAVHSGNKRETNDEIIAAFKRGELRAVTNNNYLTTGFNHPWVDYIGCFRPTKSPVLWVQMLGRGTRIAPGKSDCLVGDYARNTERLGPINQPLIPTPVKGGKSRTAAGLGIVRICRSCNNYFHAMHDECPHCGAKYERAVNITDTASSLELIAEDDTAQPEPETSMFEVDRVYYVKHEKKGSPPCLRVQYICENIVMFTDWFFPEHGKGNRHKFVNWWRERHTLPPPDTVDDIISVAHELRQPKRIKVWTNTKYPVVLRSEF